MKRITALLLSAIFILVLLPPAAAAEPKYAAFTFDDGPHKTITPRLLDELAARDIRVTFFLNGRNAEAYPEIVLRAAAEGHQIANHTYAHKQLTILTDEQVQYEVSRTREYLTELLGEDEYLVRAPYGALNDRVRGLIEEPLIMWSVDPTNGRVVPSDKMRDGIVATAHDGAIILMHDTSQGNLTASIEAMDILMAEGYQFVTVNELFEIKGVTPAGGNMYYKLPGTNVVSYFDEAKLEEHWACTSIELVMQSGIMDGDETGFHPNRGMTRGEAVTVLWRMAGQPSMAPVKQFKDVKEKDWYSGAVYWAIAENITVGLSRNQFGADSYITKEQFYTLFDRYLQGFNISEYEPKAALVLSGDDAVSTWASASVAHIRTMGFLSARDNGRFAPKAGISRAEVAELLAWFMKLETRI